MRVQFCQGVSLVFLLGLNILGSLALASRPIVTLPGGSVSIPQPTPSSTSRPSTDTDPETEKLINQRNAMAQQMQALEKSVPQLDRAWIEKKALELKESPVFSDSIQKILDFKNMRTFFVTESIFVLIFFLLRSACLASLRSWISKLAVGLLFLLIYPVISLVLVPFLFWGGAYLALVKEVFRILKL